MNVDRRQVREHQRPRQCFFVGADVFGDNDDRDRSDDALVAGPGIAHRRQAGATHAGIGRCRRADDNARLQVVREQATLDLALERRADVQAVVAAHAFIRQPRVNMRGIENEGNVGKRRFRRKFVDRVGGGTGQREVFAVVARTRRRGKEHLVILFDQDDARMRIGDADAHPVLAANDARLGKKEGRELGDGDADPAVVEQAPGSGDDFGGQILQHFQPGIRVTTECANRRRDRQANHAGARNGDAHAVFHEIGGNAGFDAFRCFP